MPPSHELRVHEGAGERTVPLAELPFTLGRRAQNHLVLAWPQISRDHARIFTEGDALLFEDIGSSHGTLINGSAFAGRHRLLPGDTITFPNCPGVRIVFAPSGNTSMSLVEMRRRQDDSSQSPEFAWLHLLLEFGRRLHTGGDVLDEILAALLDTALRLTGAERGFIFLRGASGNLDFTLGRDKLGQPQDPTALSRSTIERAAASSAPILLHDTLDAAESLGASIVSHGLRTVIAIPLRDRGAESALGVLYLDSHSASQVLTRVGQDVLQMLAAEAAQLVSNARLLREQEAARALERELDIAASIQHGLMSAPPPALAFVQARGINQACRQIGGDFYDLLALPDGRFAAVLADISGKGPAAALLAASLHGIVHAQLLVGAPLRDIAAMANQFLWNRLEGEKYATLLILRLSAQGDLDYINCGHIQPFLIAAGQCHQLTAGNVPVGLLPQAVFESSTEPVPAQARILLATDGATEAANPAGDLFGEDGLAALACAGEGLEPMVAAVRAFSQGAPLADDLTLVEIQLTP